MNRTNARDEVMALLDDALDGETVSILWDASEDPIPDAAATWVRIAMRHHASAQASLGPDLASQRRYRTRGTLFAQIFTPLGDGQTESDRLSEIVVNAMRAARTPSGVLLRNAIAKEVGIDGSWFQVNAQAEFEYDEFV